MTHLPLEILDKIFTELTENEPDTSLFLPKSFLLPLLHVCKAWHPLAEHHLYQSISIGNAFRIEVFQPIPGDTLEERRADHRKFFENSPKKRHGYEVAEDLRGTLQENTRLASEVRTLRIGIEYSFDELEKAEGTQTNIDIIRLCPNVEHIEIRGYWNDKLEALFDALGEKSPLTFFISAVSLSSYGVHSGSTTLLFKAMGKWPRLRSLATQSFLRSLGLRGSHRSAEVIPNAVCAHLEELLFGTMEADLNDFEFRSLLALCPNVKKLSVPVAGGFDSADVLALSECLRAWASSLEYVEIHIRRYSKGSRVLLDALSTLSRLKELYVTNIMWDLSSISCLPALERFAFCWYDSQLEDIVAQLEDLRKFPSLRILQIRRIQGDDFEQELKTICHRRHIHLSLFRGLAPAPDLLVDTLYSTNLPRFTKTQFLNRACNPTSNM